MSGLTPGTTLRNTFRIAASPYTSEVLLCSPVSTRLDSSSGSSLTRGPRWKLSASTVALACRCRSQAPVTSLSCRPSYHQAAEPVCWSVSRPTSTWASVSLGSGRHTSGTW